MGVYDVYRARLEVTGIDKREAALNRTKQRIADQMQDSLSCKKVSINGVEQDLLIINTTENGVKKIHAKPNESFTLGEIIDWDGYKWLITDINTDHELYTSGQMERCNYLLKWINRLGNVIERWCIVEDGTKYLIGEKSQDIMTIGDARIALTIGKDSETSLLNRGRRFLIDDLDSTEVLAYQITKPNKLFNIVNNKGVFRFILNEVNRTDDDNTELRIADYYSWKPPVHTITPDRPDGTLEEIIDDSRENAENIGERIKESGVWL